MRIISKQFIGLSLIFITLFSLVSVFASEQNDINSIENNNIQTKLVNNKEIVFGSEDDVIYGFTKDFYQDHGTFEPDITGYEYYRNGVRFIGTLHLKSTVQIGPSRFKGTYVGDLYAAGFAK